MGFRYRLVLFLVATLIGIQALTFLSAYGVVRQNVIDQGRKNLAATSSAFTRQLQAISERVSDGVRVLALDYPLRQAIAQKDQATVTSALSNHGKRIGASRMLLVGLDGRVDVDTAASARAGTAFPFADLVATATRGSRAMELAALDGRVYWIVVVPVNAPLPIAFIAAAVPVDDALVDNLRQLSVLPATIALVFAKPGGGYVTAAQTADRRGTLHLVSRGSVLSGDAALVDDEGDEFLTLVTKLATAGNSPQILAVFDYPLEDALKPFYDIVAPVSIALALGLIIAIAGAALIARGVARPIEMLATTARQIAAGDYSAPPVVERGDEIGELAETIGTMMHAVDVRQTQLETTAAALEVARDDAVRANAAKSQFLANMSHELRTPLNAVIGFGDMIHGQLLGPIGNERYVEYARDIRDSGAHLLSLVEEVLDLSKVEAGTMQLAREKTAPGETLRGALPILVTMAERGEVKFEIAHDVDQWPCVDADPLKLKQVFINLISNAIKFTPAGGRVSVSAHAGEGTLSVRIADSGIGMRAEEIALVVQPFCRAASAHDGRYQGAGLGLPLSKAIVELHGGKLAIDSAPGKGTTVTVSLPLAQTSARVAEVAA